VTAVNGLISLFGIVFKILNQTEKKILVNFMKRRNEMKIEFLFEPQDIWIGIYWKRYPKAIEFYVCILPLFPIRIYYQWR